MKNAHITVITLVVLLVVAVFIFGTGKKAEAPTPPTSNEEEKVACTMDAKMCPDGSYVGRTGPKCEFAACPVMKDTTAVKNFPIVKDATVSTVKEFTVIGKNFSFTPSAITVKKGDKVKITFENSAGFHDFVIDGYGVATKQTKSPTIEVVEFTADKIGSFEYYCSVGSHRAMGMKGILKVE